VVLPGSFLCLTEFCCGSKAFTLTHREDKSPSWSSCLLASGGIFSLWSGRCTSDKGGDKSPSLQSWQQVPKVCCGNLKLRYGTLRQFTRKQQFIVLAQTQQTCVQRLHPENTEVSPYIPLQARSRSKKQSSIHIWLHVTSLAISFPQCYVTFFIF
jgi:hypothetical protein